MAYEENFGKYLYLSWFPLVEIMMVKLKFAARIHKKIDCTLYCYGKRADMFIQC